MPKRSWVVQMLSLLNLIYVSISPILNPLTGHCVITFLKILEN